MKKLIDKVESFETRDPFITKHNNKYYRCFTKDTASIFIACSDTIDGLTDAESKCVYIPEEGREYSKELWAPELHIIDNKCYIYVACDDGDNHNHRMYVLENNSDNPVDSYVMHGKITDDSDKWAIDGTVAKYNGRYYFIWSGWEGDVNISQNLYIAEMKNPYELKTGRVMISKPEYEWEKIGSTGEVESPFINEGPFAFTADDTLYIAYSASGSWCKEYCIALLKLAGDDPLNPDCWKKTDKPVLSCNDKVLGAGHCSAVCEDDTIHIFFHAWDINEEKINWKTVSVWHGNMKLTGNGAVIE